MGHVKAVMYELKPIVPDFEFNETSCALFLSVTYHKRLTTYIENRVDALSSQYKLKVLLLILDCVWPKLLRPLLTKFQEDYEEVVDHFNLYCYKHNLTLIICWR